jgi:aminoglycoside phosphotransferase
MPSTAYSACGVEHTDEFAMTGRTPFQTLRERMTPGQRANAERRAVMNTAEFFAERRNRADTEAFDSIMARKGGEKLSEGDQVK